MEPAAPDAAKNICMNIIPMDVPVVRRLEKERGKIVAPVTVRIDISGSAWGKSEEFITEGWRCGL